RENFANGGFSFVWILLDKMYGFSHSGDEFLHDRRPFSDYPVSGKHAAVDRRQIEIVEMVNHVQAVSLRVRIEGRRNHRCLSQVLKQGIENFGLPGAADVTNF